jgi:hypothetical protein
VGSISALLSFAYFFIQPYYQPKPAAPTPFRIDPTYHDPTPYEGNASAWALAVKHSQNILIFGTLMVTLRKDMTTEGSSLGAGLYSFFIVSLLLVTLE